MERKSAFILSLLILSIAAFAPAADAPTAAGHWEGGITIQPGAELGVLIDLSQKDDGTWTGDVDIPMQAAKDLPLIHINIKGSSAEFEISGPPGTPVFHATLAADGNSMSGNFTQAGQTLPFTLKRTGEKKREIQQQTEAEVLQDIRERVKSTMVDWHVPGLAIALIKNGKVIFAEGFGEKDTKTHAPVTANTLFAIGSSTKAFTATVMGIAVDEGKVKWNEPVRTYLPSFKLQDSFASERMSPTDLLSHRSGLPRHDIMWYGSTLTRKEMFDRLKYLEPSEDFRTAFQYQNLMFITAGYLEEQVEGKKWEDLVKEKIMDPLGMSSSNFSITVSQQAPDFALPYEYKEVEGEKDKKEIRLMPFRNIDAVGPAGSINSSVTDMARWVQMNLNGGSLDGKTVISPAALDEIHSPQMIVRGGIFGQLLAFPETPYIMYGMGWFIQPYRGHRLLHHGGNIDGFSAMVSLMPDDKLGLVILTNLDGNIQADSLMFEIYDRLLGLEPIDWNGRYKLKWAEIELAAKQGESKEDEVRKKPGTKPSHPLKDFAGEFDHPAYGRITVGTEGASLNASLHGLTSPLDHFHYDIFKTTKDPLKGLKVTFLTNLNGDLDRISVPLEDGVDEIVFTRIAPASMREPAFLKQFAGEYELMSLSVTVTLHEDHLTLTVPGQPTYTLEPYFGTEFNLKDQKGFSVKFTMVKDKVTEAVFIQPNGVFTAKRK